MSEAAALAEEKSVRPRRSVGKAPEIQYEPFECSFDGHDGVKPPGTKIRYTPEMAYEVMKCTEDPLYFISNYYYIVDLDRGLVPIGLFDFQEDLIDHIHENRFSIVLASRQVGKSIISIAYILWYIIFNEYKEVAVLSKTGPDAADIMRKLKRAFKQLPQWLQQNVTKWNEGTIELENGSKVYARCTTEDAGRSASANILFLDEFAFVPTNIANRFYASAYPIISNSKTSKVIICSTPNGYNHFYVMMSKAKKGENFFKLFTIYWWQFPGRDEDWKRQTIANISMEEGKDGESIFSQEYDLQFDNTSARALVTSATQRRIADWIDNVKFIEEHKFKEIDRMTVFEEPQAGFVYFICVDTGHGVGSDSSSFSVIKVEQKGCFRQVARYSDNTVDTIEYSELVTSVAEWYNNALMLVENNGVGKSTADHLWHSLEVDNMINLDKKDFGVKMTQPLRSKGISRLKEYLDYGVMEINDYETLQQLSKFVQNRKTKKFQAEEGFHDDIVMGLVMFAYFSMEREFSSFLEDMSKGGLEAAYAKIKEQVIENNPYLIDQSKIRGESNVIDLVTYKDFMG